MIREIQIENFKSIDTLKLELGRFTMLIGANGCGKSNILEAIAMGSAAAANKLDDEFLVNRGIRASENALMVSGFNKETNHISISFEDGAKDSIVFKILDYYKWEVENKTKISEQDKAKFIDNNKLKSFLIFAPENYFLRNPIDANPIKPIGIRGEGLFKHLASMSYKNPSIFNKIKESLSLIEWFDDLEFDMTVDGYFTGRIKIKDIYLENGVKYFDQRSANEGFLYLLFYLTLFISKETPHFFAIDNIDSALNPKLASDLMKVLVPLAEKYNKQVIFTTHNPAILDGLNLNDPEQRLFVISRNAIGHTKALRIEKKSTNQNGQSVKLSEQFLRGYIGGLNF
jgi:predicted ATPase